MNKTKRINQEKHGINLKEFCERNGFDLDTLNNLLSGKTKRRPNRYKCLFVKKIF